jgi:hypothetical protein
MFIFVPSQRILNGRKGTPPMTNQVDCAYLLSLSRINRNTRFFCSHCQIIILMCVSSYLTTATMDTSLDATLPTSWQLWDLILSHVHKPPITRIIIEGYKRVVSQSGSYFNHDLYYASDDIPNGKLSYIRLQDHLPHSILQSCILPPLNCLENQLDVLASMLVQRFEENGIWYVATLHWEYRNV